MKKPAALLAALAIEVNRRVPVETLMFAAWGEHSTASPSTLESHIWRLRRVLEPARDAGQAPEKGLDLLEACVADAARAIVTAKASARVDRTMQRRAAPTSTSPG